MIDPRFVEIPDSILQVVPKSIMLEFCVLPLKDDGQSLTLLCPPDPEFPACEGEKLRFCYSGETSRFWLPTKRFFGMQSKNSFHPARGPLKIARLDFDSNARRNGLR
jgi:hypothetical protein